MNFVGQKKLIAELEQTNSRTILIQGPKHHGKKNLIRELYTEKGLPMYEVTGNAADFRESIAMMYTQTNPTVYLIPDVDTLNVTVQNMLLKVLEEPPLKATFVLTASNRILPTIKSRCVTYMTTPYTREEILSVSADNEPCLAYADSPGRCVLIKQVVDFSKPESENSLRNIMTYIKTIAVGDSSIATVLVKADEISKIIKEKNIPYFTFWLLANRIYENSSSLLDLSTHLDDMDRYHMVDFYMHYWLERNCML